MASTKYSKKHYYDIGGMLKKKKASPEMVEGFADLFEEDNPRFKRKKFMDFVRY